MDPRQAPDNPIGGHDIGNPSKRNFLGPCKPHYGGLAKERPCFEASIVPHVAGIKAEGAFVWFLCWFIFIKAPWL